MKFKFTVVLAGCLFSMNAFAADLEVSCYKGSKFKASDVPLVKFKVADTESMRLASDFDERRSASDTETIPSFAVSQYKFQPLEIFLETDDVSPAGSQIAHLHAYRLGGWWRRWEKKRMGKGRPTYYGHYQRLDKGRELKAKVICVVENGEQD